MTRASAALIAAFGVALCVTASAGAQGTEPRRALVDVSVSPQLVTVGEPFTVRVRVRAPKAATVAFPEVPGSGDAVDPVDPRVMEDGAPGEFFDRTAAYTFVAWDVGRRAPAFAPVVVAVGGQERQYAVSVPPVQVKSVLPADTTDRAPRPQLAALPMPSRLLQVAIVAVAGLLLAAWLLLRWRRRRHRNGPTRDPDAWDVAQRRFGALEALALHEAGEPGRHVIAHVDVMREYIGRRFPELPEGLDATTFLAGLTAADVPLPPHRVRALVERDRDLRFAVAPVDADEAAALAGEARELVSQVQLAHEARLRAIERPPKPRRR